MMNRTYGRRRSLAWRGVAYVLRVPIGLLAATGAALWWILGG